MGKAVNQAVGSAVGPKANVPQAPFGASNRGLQPYGFGGLRRELALSEILPWDIAGDETFAEFLRLYR
jgi:hypothetical protein